jgi:HEAT repeat protein
MIVKEASEALRKIGLAAWKRWSVVHVLGNLQDSKALPYLIDRLSDVKRNIRVEAARALGRLRDKRAVEPLLQSLKDGDWMMRAESIDALSHISSDDPGVVEEALRLLASDPSHEVKSSACRALSRSVRKEAHDAIEMLNSFSMGRFNNNK